VAVQPFLVYQAAVDILWDAGIRVVWLPASVALTATQKVMPPTLFDFMVEEAERVRRELLPPHLGRAKLPRLPEASPFCCTGVISPLQFRWRIPGRYTSYRVSVHDPAVSVHDTFAKSREIWGKECTQGPLDYDGPTLASEHLFAWRLAGIRDSSRELLAEGVFWMHSAPALPEWVQDLMRQEPDPAGRALALAQWQVRERLYEAALGHYAEAINVSQGQHEELVPAHAQIGLSLTYRKMAEELDELTKPHGSAWSYIADALNARAVRHAEEVVPAAKSRSR
jgi:hypothetical protein